MNIIAAKYTSPSGKAFEFMFEDLSEEHDKKTQTFTFPSKDGAYVQDLGMGGRRFPFSCIFVGEDCVEKSDDFIEALSERGVGVLQHPIYGSHNVVPTGTIKRTNNLVSDTFTAIVETTFSETIADDKVLKSDASATEMAAKVDEAGAAFNENALDAMTNAIDTCTVCGGKHERDFSHE